MHVLCVQVKPLRIESELLSCQCSPSLLATGGHHNPPGMHTHTPFAILVCACVIHAAAVLAAAAVPLQPLSEEAPADLGQDEGAAGDEDEAAGARRGGARRQSAPAVSRRRSSTVAAAAAAEGAAADEAPTPTVRRSGRAARTPRV